MHSVGLQQWRARLQLPRASTKVYGVSSDGTMWRYLRLEGGRLTASVNIDSSDDEGFYKV